MLGITCFFMKGGECPAVPAEKN